MEKSYLLVIILNDAKRFKMVKKKLFELKHNRFTVLDSYGTTDILENMEFANMLSSTMSGQNNRNYNKTLFLVAEDEGSVVHVMDELERVQELDVKTPGKGIMFTIPIYKSKGVRFGQ